MLIVGTDEGDLIQRVKDLEEYVLRIESSRCNLAVRLEKIEKRLESLRTYLGTFRPNDWNDP